MLLDTILLGAIGIAYYALTNSGTEFGDRVKKSGDAAMSKMENEHKRQKEMFYEVTSNRTKEELERALEKEDLENWKKEIIKEELKGR